MTTATASDLDRRIDELDAKLERLLCLLEKERCARAGVTDFMGEVAPIARSAYESIALTLHERDIDLAELGDLTLRFAESAAELNRALASFQAITSLIDHVGPLGGQAYDLLASRLDALDRRGYFTFARAGMGVLDRIVTSFDEDDIEALGDNVVLILETVKEMTQPDVMRMLQRSFSMVRTAEEPEKVSLFGLLREMRDPEVKLGVHRMLTLLRGMAQMDDDTNPAATPPEKEE